MSHIFFLQYLASSDAASSDDGAEAKVTIPKLKAHFEAYFLKRQRKAGSRLPSTYRTYVNNVNRFIDWEQQQDHSAAIDLDGHILDFSRKEWVRLPIPDGFRDSLELVGRTKLTALSHIYITLFIFSVKLAQGVPPELLEAARLCGDPLQAGVDQPSVRETL